MIALFPCPYGIDHMRTMNSVLARIFPPLIPLQNIRYGRWKDSRAVRQNMLRRFYRTLKSTEISGVFFSNLLADATVELKEKFPNLRLSGYVHGTNLAFDENPLADCRKIDREKAIYRAADEIFVGSRYLRSLLLDAFPEVAAKIFVVGFPFDQKMTLVGSDRPKTILYNHRFDGNKQPLKLLELKAALPDFSFIAASPNFNPFVVGRLQKEGISTHINPAPSVYENLLNSAMFQVSFAKHETFGVATQLAVIHGAFALAPNRASYPEFLPAEMLYETMKELTEKISFYSRNSAARVTSIQKAQRTLSGRFSAQIWLANLRRNIT